jgi:hypothetical protein
MSSSTENRTPGPQIQSAPLITGAVLVAAGMLVALAGVAVGSAHLISATRRWIDEMDVPPTEQARVKWTQAKGAMSAGASAWQEPSRVG